MKIHANWLRTTKPKAPAKAHTPVEADKRPGIPPMECEACHDYFIPANAAQVYCTAPNCVRDRATKRQQERRRLQQMMQDAERKKQKYDGIGKAQIAEVKRAFRETRGGVR